MSKSKYIKLEANNVPTWMGGIIKLVVSKTDGHCAIIDPNIEARIEDLIDDDQWDDAQRLIDETREKTGESSFLVRLQTRLDRIRFLQEGK